MKYKIGWILAALLLITLLGRHRIFLEGFHLPGTEPRNPTAVCLYAYYEKNEDYKKNLEFFLDRSLKNAKNSTERNEIINRFLFKAMALVYKQNQENIRLRRESLNVLKELRELETKRTRELERYLSKR